MKKIICDFCEGNIKSDWDIETGYELKITPLFIPKTIALTPIYDVCRDCFNKLQHIALNKEFKSKECK